MALKIMCVFAPVTDSIPCGLRVTAYLVPFKLPKGSKKNGPVGVAPTSLVLRTPVTVSWGRLLLGSRLRMIRNRLCTLVSSHRFGPRRVTRSRLPALPSTPRSWCRRCRCVLSMRLGSMACLASPPERYALELKARSAARFLRFSLWLGVADDDQLRVRFLLQAQSHSSRIALQVLSTRHGFFAFGKSHWLSLLAFGGGGGGFTVTWDEAFGRQAPRIGASRAYGDGPAELPLCSTCRFRHRPTTCPPLAVQPGTVTGTPSGTGASTSDGRRPCPFGAMSDSPSKSWSADSSAAPSRCSPTSRSHPRSSSPLDLTRAVTV